jgi:hypothetical protein
MIRRYFEKRNNPWELLAIAAMFSFSGLGLVLQREPIFALPHVGRGRKFIEALSPGGAHITGWCAISFAALFVVLYFYTRVVIRRDEDAPAPHFLDSP